MKRFVLAERTADDPVWKSSDNLFHNLQRRYSCDLENIVTPPVVPEGRRKSHGMT